MGFRDHDSGIGSDSGSVACLVGLGLGFGLGLHGLFAEQAHLLAGGVTSIAV